MSKVIAGITMSVDGYIAGSDDGPGRGLGIGGERGFAKRWQAGTSTSSRSSWRRWCSAPGSASSKGSRNHSTWSSSVSDNRRSQRSSSTA
jgi:hypothetical protein